MPGNFFWAMPRVSIQRLSWIPDRPARSSSWLMNPLSKLALWAISTASATKSMNSSQTSGSANFGLPIRNSRAMPWTFCAPSSMSRSGSM